MHVKLSDKELSLVKNSEGVLVALASQTIILEIVVAGRDEHLEPKQITSIQVQRMSTF